MTMNPLPPQAYTKDILLKAYQWLMLQNSSIKEMATTPDILVSLYLKTTRDGEHALARPSIQNFKNELRSLAGMMGELEKTPTPATATATATATAPAKPSPEASAQQAPEKARPVDSIEQLDGASRSMIQEVKEDFNLSSDLEALRMLIKVGYSRAKNLLS